MWYIIGYVVASLVVAVLAAFAVRLFHNIDNDMREELDDNKRTGELVAEARAHFPFVSKFNAVNFYLDKMQRDILHLKNHINMNNNIDMTQAMDVYRQMLRDKRLLLQERAHLARIDAEINCDYNLLANNQL
jgi:hypothetical protein